MLPIRYTIKKLLHLLVLLFAKIVKWQPLVSIKCCCILAETLAMKKLLLIGVLILSVFQTFSYSPVSIRRTVNYTLPANLNAMTLQQLLTLTPKKYRKITGKRLTFKQRIAFVILKAKLQKQLTDDKTAANKTDIGLLSLIFGGGAFVLAIIPYAGLLSVPMAIAAIVLGIIGLGRKKGDTKSIIGLVLGSVFLLLIVALIAAFSSGWY